MYDTNAKDIKSAQNKVEGAMDRIVANNSGLVWCIVKRFIGRGYSPEELYQIGMIGLIKSIKRFDFSFNVKFSTYAVPYIMGEIKRFIRDDNSIKVSRSIKVLNGKIKELQEESIKKNGKELSLQAIADKLHILKEEVAEAIESLKPLESIDEEIYDEDTGSESKLSRISNNKDESNDLINKLTVNKLIKELQGKEKEIILLRYFKEKTQTDVAKILGITQAQVSRIEKKVLYKMREKII